MSTTVQIDTTASEPLRENGHETSRRSTNKTPRRRRYFERFFFSRSFALLHYGEL